MFKVLKPFTSVNRRFSPESTPEITPDDLAGHVVPIDALVTRKFIEPSVVASEEATVAVRPAKKTAV